MTQFHSNVNRNSEEFRKNREDMLSAIGDMREILDREEPDYKL